MTARALVLAWLLSPACVVRITPTGGAPVQSVQGRPPATKPPAAAAHVDVCGNRVNDDTTVLTCHASQDPHFERLPQLQELRSLDLRGGNMQRLGVEHLKDSDLRHVAQLVALRQLDLSWTTITDVGAQHLAALVNLRELSLSGTGLSDDGVRRLAALRNLRVLELSETQVSDAGLGHLAALGNLRVLGLSETQVSDAGLTQLAALTNLRALDLSGTQVTDAGVSHLAALPGLRTIGLARALVSTRRRRDRARTDSALHALGESRRRRQSFFARGHDLLGWEYEPVGPVQRLDAA